MPNELRLELFANRKQYADQIFNKKYSVVFPVDIPAIEFVNDYREQFSSPIFPTPSHSVLDVLKGKIRFSHLLRALDISQPHTHIILNSECSQILRELKYPIVIKPDDGQGSEGVRKFQGFSEAISFLSKLPSSFFPLVAQEFFEGDLVGLNVLSINGNIFAWTLQSQGFPGCKYTLFSNSQILEAGKKICSSLQFNGVANFDIIYNPSKKTYAFLECNPRLWASTMVSTWMGVNFPYLGFLWANNSLNSDFFSPVVGEISHARKFPMDVFFRSLLRGHPLEPNGFNEASLVAYKGMLQDILPYLLSTFFRSPMAPPHSHFPLTGHAKRFQSSPFDVSLQPGSPDY